MLIYDTPRPLGKRKETFHWLLRSWNCYPYVYWTSVYLCVHVYELLLMSLIYFSEVVGILFFLGLNIYYLSNFLYNVMGQLLVLLDTHTHTHTPTPTHDYALYFSTSSTPYPGKGIFISSWGRAHGGSLALILHLSVRTEVFESRTDSCFLLYAESFHPWGNDHHIRKSRSNKKY